MKRAIQIAASCVTTLLLVVGVAFIGVKYQFSIGTENYIEYWGASVLWLYKQNSYSADALFSVQKMVTPGIKEAMMMWNPPHILPLLIPFALLPFYAGSLVWFALSILVVIVCFDRLLTWQGLRQDLFQSVLVRGIALVLLFPIYSCLYYGQLSPFLLLALVSYLRFSVETNSKRSQVYSGFALAGLALKPHLLYLLYVYEFVRSFHAGRWTALMSMIGAITALATLAWLINPNVIQYYLEATSTPPIYWHSPAIGSWLQYLTGTHHLLYRLAPSLLTMFVVLVWLWKNRCEIENPSIPILLIAISLVTTAYGWVFDYLVLLPVFVWILAQAKQRSGRLSLKATCVVLVVMNIVAIVGNWRMEYYLWYPTLTLLLVLSTKERASSRSLRPAP